MIATSEELGIKSDNSPRSGSREAYLEPLRMHTADESNKDAVVDPRYDMTQ